MGSNLKSAIHYLLNRIKVAGSFDLRSLAFARISLGISLVYYFFTLFQNYQLFLTHDGIITRKEFIATMAHPWSWSVYYINDHPNFIFLLLLFHFALVISFLVGYKTKLATFLLWIMTVSLHNRNWFVLNGGDDLVRCCLLFSIFIPFGKYFSIDYLLNKSKVSVKNINHVHFSWVNYCYIYLLLSIYIISGLFKNHPIWRTDFTALDYALHLDMFVRPFGIWIREQYGLLKMMTAMAMFLEVYGPFLLLFSLLPKLFTFTRYLVTLGFMSFHLGIDLLINVGPFPYYAISFWLAFLPADFWKQNIRVVYYLRQFLTNLQTSTIKFYQKVLPKFKLITSLSFVPAIIFLPLLAYWPLHDLKRDQIISYAWVQYSEAFVSASRWLHTYQNWKLFAPFPKTNNVWFQVIGSLSSGEEVNLHLNSKDVSAQYPDSADVSEQFYSENIRKMFLTLEDNERNRELMAKFYCRWWNELGKGFTPGKLASIEIKFYGQRNLASGNTMEPEKKVLLKHICTSP